MEALREHILIIHAFSGCDTTSAPFGKGKTSFLYMLKKNEKLKQISEEMNGVSADRDAIGNAGIEAFRIIYGGSVNDTLSKLT